MTSDTPTLYRAEFYRPDRPPLQIEIRAAGPNGWRAVATATGVPFHGISAATWEDAARLVERFLAPAAAPAWQPAERAERKPLSLAAAAGAVAIRVEAA